MKCRVCDRSVDYPNDGLCIWCDIFGTIKVHGRYTFPDGKLTITDNFHNLPSVEDEEMAIKALKDFDKPKRNDPK